jgi:hypothetical protein
VIFLDRSIARSVAIWLRDEPDEVLYLDDRYPPATPDSVWLADAGAFGWLVITRDKRIRLRSHERRAIEAAEAGCFVLASRLHTSPDGQFQLIRTHLAEMERLFVATPRPFVFTIDSRGTFRRRL